MASFLDRTLRSTFERAAGRVASSERLMSVVYDVVNKEQFTGLRHHEEMLSDQARVDAYHRGIHRNVQQGDVVVDLGTGTGLLAFMASRAGAKKVYALDHSDVIDVARELAAHNGFSNIEFVQTNSRDFTPPEPIDVLIHEQMNDELFGENMVQNLLDFRHRALRPDSRMLPGHFQLFVEPVTLHDHARVSRIWDTQLPDQLDFSVLRTSAVAAQHLPADGDHAYIAHGAVKAPIGVPTPLLDFDLMTLDHPTELALRHQVSRTATTDAPLDGFCVWFSAQFDAQTELSTSPFSAPTCWGTRLMRTDRRTVSAGETISFEVAMHEPLEASTWVVTIED